MSNRKENWPTKAQITDLLEYDSELGLFYWAHTWHGRVKGVVAGSVRRYKGRQYRFIRIAGIDMRAHILVWSVLHDDVPDGKEIDHIDGNGLNNRETNLRLVTSQGNSRNRSRSMLNISGCTGVTWEKSKSKWRAKITVSYRQIYLGLYDTKDEAIAARKAAEIKYGFHKNHDRKRVAQ